MGIIEGLDYVPYSELVTFYTRGWRLSSFYPDGWKVDSSERVVLVLEVLGLRV